MARRYLLSIDGGGIRGILPPWNTIKRVVGMANEANRLVTGRQVEIDERFRPKGTETP